MRKWLDLIKQQLNEAEARPTATRERTVAPEIGIAHDSLGAVAAPKATSPVPGKKASKKSTRSAVRADLSPEGMTHLSNLAASGLRDEISDDEARANAGYDGAAETLGATEPEVKVENLPAIISHAVARTDHDEASSPSAPEWHQVKHLPGYMQNAIRAMGRMVFRPFTDTPIEDIQVLSTLSNPEYDVKRMAGWITRNGIRDDAAELRFHEIMPGYSAKVAIYNTQGYQFMIVEDLMGYYIYGYTGGRGVHLAAPRMAPRLEGLDGEAAARLKGLAELANPLKTQYQRFMEDVPGFLGGDDEQDGQNGQNTNAAAPQGSGQSNSTTKPVAPGQTPDQQGQTQTPTAQPTPAPMLNPAQQAAKDRADAATAAANNPQR